LADTTDVHAVWAFSKASERLELRCEQNDDGFTLVIMESSRAPRSYFFTERRALTTFQRDMEQFLLHTGWVFAEYEPDRRSGRDRRTFPRIHEDRRRWWTDGVKPRRRR
jgi:hypothetical protein